MAKLSLTRAEAFTLLMAAGNGADWYDEEESRPNTATDRAAFRRARSKLARAYGFRDPHPDLVIAPRATRHRKPRKQSGELSARRQEAGRLMYLRRCLRVIIPEAEKAIGKRLKAKTFSARYAIDLINRMLEKGPVGMHYVLGGNCVHCHCLATDGAVTGGACPGVIPDDPSTD